MKKEEVILMRFLSPTFGICQNYEEVVDKIFTKILSSESTEWTIAIGTDSQNKRNYTNFCSAILVIEKGKGGNYFYSTSTEARHHVVQTRMLREAQMSIELSKKIIDEIETKILQNDEVLNNSISFEIHCDLGNDGKSKDSIGAAIGWITAEFGNTVVPKIKPNSPAASCIADKYTK